MLVLIKCSLNIPDITFSLTFEINVKFDTGRIFFKISLSTPVVFKSGRIRAVLSDLGIRESRKDIFDINNVSDWGN